MQEKMLAKFANVDSGISAMTSLMKDVKVDTDPKDKKKDNVGSMIKGNI